MKDNEFEEAYQTLEQAVDELKEACTELGAALKTEIGEPVGKLLDGILDLFK